MLLRDLIDGKPAGVVGRLQMIGHSEILEAALTAGLGYRLQRFCAIGGVGVTVQDAVQFLVSDELGNLAFQRTLDFAASLAQLRLDESRPSARR